MNLMHFASQISTSLYANGLLFDIDYSYTSCKSIWNDMMSIRSNSCYHEFDAFDESNK